MVNHKIDRIESDMTRYISNILLTEARDEQLKDITITGCKVSHDLSYAKIYFTSLSSTDIVVLEKKVHASSHFIRGRLSEVMDLRQTPELHFLYDKSVAYGNKIEKIIKSIHQK